MIKQVIIAAGIALAAHGCGGEGAAQTAQSEHASHGAQPALDLSHASHADHASKASSPAPAGYAPVMIDPSRAKAIELDTAAVEERDFTKTLRTVGVVALDETRSAHVHAKVRGWIHGIAVNFVGKKVAAGEPLCSIYSQEVYTAELEYLALINRGAGERDPLREAARRRLALWDVPKSELARLESTREPQQTFPLLAPRSGIVVAKEALEGMFVDPSSELFTVSDLSRVWALADVYEADVSFVHLGDDARLEIEGEKEPHEAKIAFLAPTIDVATRTLKARFELDNERGTIRPGAFVSVALNVSLGRGLAIPESAVIRTGARSIVFVAHGEHFQPREVTLGPLAGDHYRVDAGLTLGDRVATGAQFLLDSESRLRATNAPGGGHVH